ncbi:growth/differentiation factor 8-like [Acanthaster planci]|uniref:Growth/differentiation factor 8-like n=1 Tax=Acanthaster planci TaxID=133434 RepID=A0A8B7ZJ18_ACAPL|nr:growth/differentiation factor 8-like [Acanthaster planci]
MAGFSRASLYSRLVVAASVACLASFYCSLVGSAMVPANAQTLMGGQRGDGDPSPPLAHVDSHTPHRKGLKHPQWESDSKFSSSKIAIDNNHPTMQHFTKTKDAEVSDYNQRINMDGSSTRENRILLDDSLMVREEEQPIRSRVARAAAESVPVASSKFLEKTVESFNNFEGSGSDQPSQDDVQKGMVEEPSAETRLGVDNADCPECLRRKQEMKKLPPEKLRQMRLEQIKKRILSKLKMDQAPNISASSVDIPEPLARGRMVENNNDVSGMVDQEDSYLEDDRWEEEELNEIEENYQDTSQVIVTAQEGLGACPHKTSSSGCFSFEITSNVEENIVSAKLWFLLNDSPMEVDQNRTLVVSHIGTGRHSRRTSLHTVTVVYRADWVTVDVTRAVRHLVVHAKKNYLFEVRCTTCLNTGNPTNMKSGRRPFLVLGKTERRPRLPRSIICPPNHTTCCKEIFYVSFAELKWDWIIEPKGYSANYCRGSCEDNVAQGYGHTYIMTTVKNMNVDRGLSIIPCCAPIKTKPLVLLYYDNEGFIYKKQLQNMITESCACM